MSNPMSVHLGGGMFRECDFSEGNGGLCTVERESDKDEETESVILTVTMLFHVSV